MEFPFRGARASYGLGWFLTETCGVRVATHGGTIAGYSSQLAFADRPGIAVVALANGKSGADRIGVADKLAAAALRSALGCGS